MLNAKWSGLSMILILTVAGVGAQTSKTFHIPGSVLLFGNYGELHIVRPTGGQVIHPPVEVGYNRGYFAYPSIAPRGGAIAWGFATAYDRTRSSNRGRFALGLFIITEQKWRTYGEFDGIGDVAISANGSQVALMAGGPTEPRLLIFDIASETFQDGPYQRGMQDHSNLSWAPDGTRLVTEIQLGDKPSVVAVLNLKTAEVRKLGEGFGGRWSPTGEWIAYYLRNQCMVVRPDGTETKVVMKLGRSRNFGWGSPVWSPDGKQLLVNVSKNGGPLLDVILLDIASGRTTTKSTSGLPVFGWVRYQR